jgi:peptidoglycan/LPS O-acetylase OafA/YrhL
LLASDGGNGYTGTATLSCSGAPQGAACTVTPSTVSVGLSPAPFQVTVTTTGKSSAALMPLPGGLFWVFGFLLAAASLTQRRRVRSLATAVLLVGVTALALSCGGSSAGSTHVNPPAATVTPPGTYALTISASTGGAQNSYLVYLNVN